MDGISLALSSCCLGMDIQEVLEWLCLSAFVSLVNYFLVNVIVNMDFSDDDDDDDRVSEDSRFVKDVIQKGDGECQGKASGSEDPLDDDAPPVRVYRSSWLEFLDIFNDMESYGRSLVGCGEIMKSEGEIDENVDSSYQSQVVRVIREIVIESDEEDDWEGVERSELEKVFGDATVFVEELGNLENDVKLQLYDLSKIVLEGACNSPQSMAMKIIDRVKWNSCQQPQTPMSREMAMEHYISLLSKTIPDWNGNSIIEECQ